MVPLENVAVADALMRGIAEARVSDVTFRACGLAPGSMPGFTRLLQASCLERLSIHNTGESVWEAPCLTSFCHALRSSTLQVLDLSECYPLRDHAPAGELVAALVGHQTLRKLSLFFSGVGNTDDAWRRAAGEQLASLVTRNTVLQELSLMNIDLGEAGLALIFETLPQSSPLKELHIYGETISREFARDAILPAVRANTSLRKLKLTSSKDGTYPELVEAQAIVAARTQPDACAIAAA